jgi:Icc-related predicted phosphoesterase
MPSKLAKDIGEGTLSPLFQLEKRMTKVQIISDLHTEFKGGSNKYLDFLKSDAEVLVVAGDLSVFQYLEKNIIYLCDMFPEVVYVTGNHDYYHASFHYIDEMMMNLQAKLDNFNWLNNSKINIGGVRFIGATLWFEENAESKNKLVQRYISDFSVIKDCDPIAFHRYDETLRYFEKEMQEGDFVVTHQMPSFRSIPPRFEKSLLNCYFANPLDDFIRRKKPAFWIHGHTHDPCRYIIGKTQLICNPLGYSHERLHPQFKERLVIDV